MPVKIACPKCQQKYQLPDKALGKAVKCKACGTSFKTKRSATDANARIAAQPKKLARNEPSRDQLAEFGIDGSLDRQDDIFDGAVIDPRSSRGLGNFAAEDPGFDTPKKEQPPEEVNPYAAPVDDGLSAVLANPVLTEGRGTKKKARSENNLAQYKTARLGLSIVYACLNVLGLIFIGSFVLGIIGGVVPSFLEMFQEGGSMASVGNILQIVARSVNVFALLGLFVGMCVCIATPEDGERKLILLSVGSIVVSFSLLIVGGLMGGAAIATAFANTGEDGDGATTGIAAIGIMFILIFAIFYGLLQASELFFAKFMGEIGRNLNSKTVQKYEARVVKFWYWAIGLSLGGPLVISLLQVILSMVGATAISAILGILMIVIMMAGGIALLVVIYNLITLIEKTVHLLKAKK